jgi:hypothetical protein
VKRSFRLAGVAEKINQPLAMAQIDVSISPDRSDRDAE